MSTTKAMKVDLSFHATNLRNVARLFTGISDPFAVITHVASNPGSKPVVLGKTETIRNTLSPYWVNAFTVEYELGTPYVVSVNIFDEQSYGKHIDMGGVLFEVGELLGSRGNTKAKRLKNGGTLFAFARKTTGSGILRFQLKGLRLTNVESGMFKKSDPFFELSRKVGVDAADSLTWDNVYRSKAVKNDLNPVWDEDTVEISHLCSGDQDLPILVSVYDFESSGKHVSMGQFETSVNGMLKSARTGNGIKLRKNGKEVGYIVVEKAEVCAVEDITQKMSETPVSGARRIVGAVEDITQKISETAVSGTRRVVAAVAAPFEATPTASSFAPPANPNFIDYISGGCEVNVVVAIDFTGSNGDPMQPGTLHYLHAGGRNDYERAISSIVSILAKYDTDQRFPVLGFGAKYDGVVRHCFQCGPTEEVHGVAGVLEAYRQVFQSGLIMSAPTVFTEVIEFTAARAARSMDVAKRRGAQAYSILLILTDGAVSDVQATAACLRKVSSSPMSVVIVGVGNDDFSAMHFLDNSAGPGSRDIAQFVPFNLHSQSSVALTSETLREIPDQLTSYFKSQGIPPLPPVTRTDSTITVQSEEEEIDLSLDIRDDEIAVTGGGYNYMDGFAATR